MAEQMKPSGIDWIGDIPKSWKVKPIAYMTKSRSGGTPDRNNLLYWENGTIPWMSSGEVNKVNIYDTDEKITTLAVHHSSAKIISKNAVMVALNGQGKTKGMSAILRIDSACNQSLCAFSCNAGILYYEYLFWCFQTMYTYLRQMSGDDVRDGLAASYVKKQKIPVPKYEEQQAIADFLDKECAQIDSIAADLEKQIELLQQYKKSLITEAVTKGLDKSVPMKDSGVEWIGEIPEHWEISRVRHLASLCSGATPSKDVLSYWEGNIPWVSSQEVKSDIIKDTSLHISEEAINSCSTQLMPAGTLVMVVRSGILQHTIPVALLGVPATINQDIKAFQFNHLMLPAYFKYYIQGENDALLSVIIKDKTTVESVDNQLLLSLKIMVPPIEEQKAIVAFLNYKCGYIDKILNDKQEQLNLLMQHKKSLIYEYVTGKKRVKEVQ